VVERVQPQATVVGDRDVCVGAGMCALSAPALFDQDDDLGLVVVRSERVEGDALALARKAVALCPSGALSLRDDVGA
jgi:ferredoxin